MGDCAAGGSGGFFETYPDPVVYYEMVDEEPCIAGVNPAFEDAFDADQNALVGGPLERVLGDVAADGRDGLADLRRSPTDEPPARDWDERYLCDAQIDEDRQFAVHRVADGDAGGYLLFRPAEQSSSSTEGTRYAEFARILTHDLRNPLEVAEIRIEAARETGETEHLDRAHTAVDRMGRLIGSLRSFLLKGEGIERQPVSLADSAGAAWEMVDTPRGRLDVATDLGTVEADPDLLQELFENIFRNAVEHGSTGSQAASRSDDAVEHGANPAGEGTDDPSVTVEVGRSTDGFYVADDGPGMSAADREQVFEAGTSGGGGLGFGIVERIANAHGWAVTVTESESGGVRVDIET